MQRLNEATATHRAGVGAADGLASSRQASAGAPLAQPSGQGRPWAHPAPALLQPSDYANPLIQRYAACVPFSPAELQQVRRLSRFAHRHSAQTSLSTQGDMQQPRLMLSGWACQQQVLRGGRRQIVRFLIPGDLFGSMAWPAMPMVSGVTALTACTVADARPFMQAFHEPDESTSGFASLARMAMRAEETGLLDQIVRLGGRTAYERLIHLMLELHSRLQMAGLADPDGFMLPLTQEVLADGLGMSFVHTNRTLQQARKDRLFVFRAGKVTFEDLPRMQAIAEWDES